MRYLLTSLALLAAFAAAAQVEVVYPYNPDGNADSVISAPDLLDFLPIFGGTFTPEEITVNGEGLSTVLEEMQSVLDSLSTITNGTTAFGEKVFLDFDSMKWAMDTWEAAVFNPMTDGILEIVPDEGEAGILSVLVIPEELDPCAAIYDDCNFPPWTFWYANDLSNYQYGTDYPLTIPVRQSELVFVGSGYDGAWNVKFIWTPLQTGSNGESTSNSQTDTLIIDIGLNYGGSWQNPALIDATSPFIKFVGTAPYGGDLHFDISPPNDFVRTVTILNASSSTVRGGTFTGGHYLVPNRWVRLIAVGNEWFRPWQD